jgi:hypothetical protein
MASKSVAKFPTAMISLWPQPKVTPLRYWYVLIDDFETSTPEFYNAIRGALSTRRVPELESSTIEIPEGGAISARRQYLRLRRERLVFDICSASFGTGWFFSCRFGEIPLKFRLLHLLLLLYVLVSILGLFLIVFGFQWGPLLFVLNVFGFTYLLGSVMPMGMYGVDAFLLKVPLLGPCYEIFFRRATYYRDDTRRMYCDTVDTVVRGVVRDVAGTGDVRNVEFREDASAVNLGFWERLKEGMKAIWPVSKRG